MQKLQQPIMYRTDLTKTSVNDMESIKHTIILSS